MAIDFVYFFNFSNTTDHEHSPVGGDDLNDSLARDTAGSKSSKHVDEEHNSINDQRSRDANEEDVKKKPTSAVDGFAQEVVDTAFKLGSSGHVKNVIAMFSSEDG
jgi:hypothetical protein